VASANEETVLDLGLSSQRNSCNKHVSSSTCHGPGARNSKNEKRGSSAQSSHSSGGDGGKLIGKMMIYPGTKEQAHGERGGQRESTEDFKSCQKRGLGLVQPSGNG
jgi:hypothetical protein